MTEEKPKTVSKLLIDKENDFKFHCAYLAYSQAWDENNDDQARERLNSLIESLSTNKTDYHAFYRELSNYREDKEYRGRNRIQSQRKSEWRHREAGRTRNWRHKRK